MGKRAVFVLSNHRSSAVHRGIHVAALLSQHHALCSDLNSTRTYDVYIHVKFACKKVLGNGASHVLDRLDSLQRIDMRPFDAEITNTRSETRSCATKMCITVPHHVNLPCRRHGVPKNPPVVGLVGQNSRPDPNLLKLLRSRYKVVVERTNPCAFFDAIDVAIAWKKSEMVNLPQERFTNPIYFRIPTIGHKFHASYGEYAHSAPFLCDTPNCTLETIRGIVNRSLWLEFESLRAEVESDVSDDAMRRLYGFLIDHVNRTGIRQYFGPVPIASITRRR